MNRVVFPSVQKSAQNLSDDISAKQKAAAAKRDEERRVEEKKDQELQTQSLQMLNPKEAAKIPIEKRREIFERSIKALHLDRSKPEGEKMYQNLYKSMVLQGDKEE